MTRICVFLGSKSGHRQQYRDAAKCLGEYLASKNIGIVYGGASIGLMGDLAYAASNAGGEVIGVIPNNIAEIEIPPESITRMIYTKTLAKREKIMFGLSDGFIALPGGIGTLEEVVTAMTWNVLKYHKKPIGLLNAGGYFDKFVDLLEFQQEEGFLYKSCTEQLIVSDDVELLADKILKQV